VKLSRRPWFFALVAVVALLMVPVTPSDYWKVNWLCAGLGAFWAIMLGIEEMSAQRDRARRKREDG
jgi:hypothetical protein